MKRGKKLRCALFVSALSLRQLGDPSLDCDDNLSFVLSSGFFVLTTRRSVQSVAVAFDEFHSGVHGPITSLQSTVPGSDSIPRDYNFDVSDFAPTYFFSKP